MLGQVGPQKLIEQLKAQAPRYAKLLPELPMLLDRFLRDGGNRSMHSVEELLLEQRRTNRLLQGLVYAVLGFALGMLTMQIVIRAHLF